MSSRSQISGRRQALGEGLEDLELARRERVDLAPLRAPIAGRRDALGDATMTERGRSVSPAWAARTALTTSSTARSFVR